MSKRNQTANEAQLKARKTSLERKTNDELITIVLRKDKSERSMNSKIQELTTLLKEAESLNERNSIRISDYDKEINKLSDKINTLVERNDNLIIERNNLFKENTKLKDKCEVLCKGGITCLGIIAFLVIIIMYISLF